MTKTWTLTALIEAIELEIRKNDADGVRLRGLLEKLWSFIVKRDEHRYIELWSRAYDRLVDIDPLHASFGLSMDFIPQELFDNFDPETEARDDKAGKYLPLRHHIIDKMLSACDRVEAALGTHRAMELACEALLFAATPAQKEKAKKLLIGITERALKQYDTAPELLGLARDLQRPGWNMWRYRDFVKNDDILPFYAGLLAKVAGKMATLKKAAATDFYFTALKQAKDQSDRAAAIDGLAATAALYAERKSKPQAILMLFKAATASTARDADRAKISQALAGLRNVVPQRKDERKSAVIDTTLSLALAVLAPDGKKDLAFIPACVSQIEAMTKLGGYGDLGELALMSMKGVEEFNHIVKYALERIPELKAAVLASPNLRRYAANALTR